MGKHFVGKEKPKEEAEKGNPLPCPPSLFLFPCTPCKFLICCARLRTAACKAGLLLPATPLSPPLPHALHVFLDSLRLLCELFFGSPRLALPRLGSAFIISHNHLTVQRKSVESARRRAPFSLGRRGVAAAHTVWWKVFCRTSDKFRKLCTLGNTFERLEARVDVKRL